MQMTSNDSRSGTDICLPLFEVRVFDQYSQRWHHSQLKSAEPLCAYFPFARHRREVLSYNIKPTSTSRSIQWTYGKCHLLYEPFLQEVKVQVQTASATWLLPFTPQDGSQPRRSADLLLVFAPAEGAMQRLGRGVPDAMGYFGHRERPCLGSVLSSEPQDFRDQTVRRVNAWSLDCKVGVKWY